MSQPYANLLGALKEGYFFKCGGNHKSWKLRWFVLTKDILYYFDKETSTEPLGIIPLKDYQRCKGMDGDAYQATGKQNSFFLQTPYRMYKAYCKDWKTSELWADSIASLGEFLKKKEDIRKPTRYQQEVIRLTYEVVCFASSLIHWFKLVVDSTPSYKNGMPSIYASAIYDIPRDLGAQSIELAKYALRAIGAPNTPSNLELLKIQASKVMVLIVKAEGFVVCCADTHKVKFNADLEVLRKATKALEEMKPMFPINEISDCAVTMCKTAYSLCKSYVKEEDVLHAPMASHNFNTASSIPSAYTSSWSNRSTGSRSASVAEPSPTTAEITVPVTPSTLLQDYKSFARVIGANLEALKGKPMFHGEQAQIQAVQTCINKLESATTDLVTALQQGGVASANQIVALYHDIPANCREIIAASEKVYVDRA